MLFALICTDAPGRQDLRAATRDRHLAYLDGCADRLLQAGPLLDEAGQPCGSLLIVDAADRAAAARFAEADPYAQAGLFEGVTIHAYRQVFREGARAP